VCLKLTLSAGIVTLAFDCLTFCDFDLIFSIMLTASVFSTKDSAGWISAVSQVAVDTRLDERASHCQLEQ